MTKTQQYVIIFIVVLLILIYVAKKYIMAQILVSPLKNYKVTSPFGPRVSPLPGASSFHNGIDIASPSNVVSAPLDGTIYSLFNDTKLGGVSMVIKHEVSPGVFWLTGYADLGSYAPGLKIGDKVKQGQQIATAGSGPISTGVHVHFTLTNPKGQKVDPQLWLNKPLSALA